MSLMLIVDLCLCNLNQLLKLSDLEFEKVDHIPTGVLLSLKGDGKLERRLKPTGKSFKMVVMFSGIWDLGFDRW